MPPTPPPSVSTPALPSSSSAGIILDSDQIPEGVSKSFVRLPGEEQSEFHARVTHLHHQRQNIRQIGDLASVRNLTVLYLYENRLTKIERLDPVPNLQLLYLQRNSIGALENLGHLVKLRKLYLSGNRISIVEGLDKLVSLRELHVDNQRLSEGQSLVFDPRSCRKLQQLQVLNTAGNRMVTLQPLQELRRLRRLDASRNLLDDLDLAVLDVLARMASLEEADLRGNPVAERRTKDGRRHWESVVGSCPGLTDLDGRRVAPGCRAMMKAMRTGKKVADFD